MEISKEANVLLEIVMDPWFLDIAKEWEKYFEELLNCEEPDELFMFNLGNINNQECLKPTLQ
jgi:hypothetical protein